MKRYHSIPLHLWLVIILFSLIILAGFYWIKINYEQQKNSPQYKTFNFNLERTESLIDRTEDEVLVVLFGTSLFRNAFYYDDEMNSFAQEQGLDNVRFIRFTLANAELEDFKLIYPRIAELNPDYIFFEANLIYLKKQVDRSLEFQIHNLKKFIGMYLKDLISKRKNLRENTIQCESAYSSFYDDKQLNYTEYQKKLYYRKLLTWEVQNYPLDEQWDQIFDQLNQIGCELIVLKTSRSLAAQPIFNQLYAKNQQEIKTKYFRQYHLNEWSLPFDLPDENYSDFAHLNPSGRKAFCQWFCQRLMGDLRQ